MKEEEDDRYKRINERFTNVEKKILDIDRKYESKSEESKGAHVDRNQGKAVITRFQNETSEPEIIQLLKESITEIGMTMENLRIECPAKPITHAFIHFKKDEERNKFVRSANMLKKRVTRKELKKYHDRWTQMKEFIKNGVCQIYCIHEKHNIPLDSISTNWTLKHISVKGQLVVKTCQNETLTYIKYHDIKAEVEEQKEKLQSKKNRNDCEQSRDRPEKKKVRLRVVKDKQQHKEGQAQKC